MNIAKQFIEKGIQQGMLAGMQQGMLEGERRGESKAIEFFVRNMHSDGQDVGTIAKFTNLTASEVGAIVKKLTTT